MHNYPAFAGSTDLILLQFAPEDEGATSDLGDDAVGFASPVS